MAQQYADKTNLPEVWTELGACQLQKGMLKEAMVSFIKAKNHVHHANVINQCVIQGIYEELIDYLVMARENGLKDKSVDSELIFCYAKCGDKYSG